MVFKKLDNRLRVLMENGITLGHRSLFLIVGPKARDQVKSETENFVTDLFNFILPQVVILHQMLSKSQVKARPSVLWCYKKELGFSSYVLLVNIFFILTIHLFFLDIVKSA